MQSFTPKQYLKIDIASNFGLDKKTWIERIRWFDQNEAQLLSLVPQADNPAMFYAGVKAWEKTQKGESTGYMISLDATSSGLQLLAALTCDRKAAQLCNVVNVYSSKEEQKSAFEEALRADAYTDLFDVMTKKIGEEGKIKRDDLKQAIMTSLYGSIAMPKQVFGEGALLNTFYETMKEAAPLSWELNEAFLMMWDPTKHSNDWVLPDNFHVHIKVMDTEAERFHFLNEPFDVIRHVNKPMESGRSLGANSIHSVDGMIVREMTRRCDYDPVQIKLLNQWFDEKKIRMKSTFTNDDKMVVILWGHYQTSGYLSARILNHLNPDNLGHVDEATIRDLISSLPNKPFKVVSIHDCFRCHANYGDDLRKQYANQLMLIARSNLLEWIISQIVGRPISINKGDPDMWKDVINADYALS